MASPSHRVFHFLVTLSSLAFFTSLAIPDADECAASGCNCTTTQKSALLASCSGPRINVSAALLRLTDSRSNVDEIRLSEAFVERVTVTMFSTSSKLTQLFLNKNGIRSVEIGAFKALSALKTLSLENNQIRILDPGAFSGLNHLTVLNLADNELYAVDEGLFSPVDVPSLTVLDLRRCRVSDFRLADDLRHLLTVNLADNRLDSFPVFGNGLDSLIEIDISNNRILSLDGDTWLPFPGPKTLRLDGNAIETLSNASIFASRPFNDSERYKLTEITMARNRISFIEKASLHGVVQIEVLDLSFNRLSVIDSESLPWRSLTKVLVHDNPWDCTTSSIRCLNSWMVNQPSSVGTWNRNLSCASPPELAGRHIYGDQVLDHCKDSPPLTSSSAEKHTGLYISVCVLIVTATGAALVFVMLRRRRRPARPIFIDPQTTSPSHRRGVGTLSAVIGRLKNDSPSRRGRSTREDDDSWSSSVSYRQMDNLSTPSSNHADDQNELGI